MNVPCVATAECAHLPPGGRWRLQLAVVWHGRHQAGASRLWRLGNES